MADSSYDGMTDVDSDSDAPDQPCQSTKRRRGANREWCKVKEFDTTDEALEFIKSEGTWSVETTHYARDGKKVRYRCNLVKQKDQQCPAAIQALYHSDRETVTVFRTKDDHHHVEQRPSRGLPMDVRNVVQELLREGIRRPQALLAAIRGRGYPEPTPIQLRNFLQYYRKKTEDPLTLNVSDFEAWCRDLSKPSEDDPDAAFVIQYETSLNQRGEGSVRMFTTTPRLLELARNSTVLHAYGTYKVNWQGLPVIIIGTTDQDRRFHPIGAGVASGETADDYEFMFRSIINGLRMVYGQDCQYCPDVLVADAADAITNAFAAVFGPQFKRITCWAHVIRAIDKKLSKINDTEIRQRIRHDICELQLCESETVFDAVVPLFLAKWSGSSSQDIDTFMNYFQTEWITGHRNWFEGYARNVPSTNTALDATNNCINRDFTLRSGLPLLRFLKLFTENVVRTWSNERDPASVSYVPFVDTPSKTTAMWTKSYQWARQSKGVLSKPRGDGWVDFYVAADDNGTLTPDVVNEYRSAFTLLNWPTFEHYARMRRRVWVISMFNEQWQRSTCTCPVHLKEYICKHTLGLAIRKKYCDAPHVAKKLPIRGRPKRGRKK